MADFWFTGSPYTYAAANQRAQRDMGAVSGLAESAGRLMGRYGDYAQEGVKIDEGLAQYGEDPGDQANRAVAQAMQPAAGGTPRPSAASGELPSEQPPGRANTDSALTRIARGAFAPLGLMRDPEREQKRQRLFQAVARNARIGREGKILTALGDTVGHSRDPAGAIRAVAPTLAESTGLQPGMIQPGADKADHWTMADILAKGTPEQKQAALDWAKARGVAGQAPQPEFSDKTLTGLIRSVKAAHPDWPDDKVAAAGQLAFEKLKKGGGIDDLMKAIRGFGGGGDDEASDDPPAQRDADPGSDQHDPKRIPLTTEGQGKSVTTSKGPIRIR